MPLLFPPLEIFSRSFKSVLFLFWLPPDRISRSSFLKRTIFCWLLPTQLLDHFLSALVYLEIFSRSFKSVLFLFWLPPDRISRSSFLKRTIFCWLLPTQLLDHFLSALVCFFDPFGYNLLDILKDSAFHRLFCSLLTQLFHLLKKNVHSFVFLMRFPTQLLDLFKTSTIFRFILLLPT